MTSTITLKAESPVYGGLTIGRRQGKVVMIKGAIPGETVEVRVDEEKKDYSTATVVRVLEPSPDRVAPESLHFGICGGCQLQYITYGRQVRIKEQVLKDCLKRIAGLDVELAEPLTGKPWNYRHRGQFKVSEGRVGLFREKSHEVVDIESCPLMTERVNEYFGKAKALLKGGRAGVGVKEVHISCDDGALALVKARSGAKAHWDGLAGDFLKSGFAGVFVELDDRRLLKYGEEYMTLDLLGLKYTVSPMSFFQSNWELNRKAVRLACEELLPLGGKTVLDLYSGAGNFALPLAGHAGKVVAVEENPYAVADGKRNLKLGGIKNCSFVRSSVDALNITEPVDVLVADPPRAGLSALATGKIFAMSLERVAYISCDPATLSRDLKRLRAGYVVESIRMVDFFPQTYHIEALAFLRCCTP